MTKTKQKPINLTTSYHDGLFDFDEIRRLARRFLDGVEFDTVVGTGLSGTLVLPIIAEEFGANVLAVRKDDDQSTHSSSRYSGFLGEKFLIVDDFVSSGATIRRILRRINETYEDNVRRGDAKEGDSWVKRFVGFYGYSTAQAHRDKSPEEIENLFKTPFISPMKLYKEQLYIGRKEVEMLGLIEPEPEPPFQTESLKDLGYEDIGKVVDPPLFVDPYPKLTLIPGCKCSHCTGDTGAPRYVQPGYTELAAPVA